MKPSHPSPPPLTRGSFNHHHRHLAPTVPNSIAAISLPPRLATTVPPSSAHSALSSSSTRISVAGAPTVKTTPGSSSSRSFISSQPSSQNSSLSSSQLNQHSSRTRQYNARLQPTKAQPVPAFFAHFHEDRITHHLAHYRDLLLVPSNVSSHRSSLPLSESTTAKIITLNINGLSQQKVIPLCHLFMALTTTTTFATLLLQLLGLQYTITNDIMQKLS